MSTLGERAKIATKMRGISQEILAEKSGVSKSTISFYMSNRSFPNEKFFVVLTELIPDLNLNWLIMGDGEMSLSSSPEELTTLKNELEELKAERRNLISSLGAMSQSFSTRINTNLAKLKAVCKTAGFKHKLTFDELLMLNATPVYTVGLHS